MGQPATGPLVDMQGRVGGILTLKSLLTSNLGFAVGINDLKPLLARPNPVPIDRWVKQGALDAAEWTPLFGANWHARVPPELQEKMLRHIQHLRDGDGAPKMLQVGDRAPAIVLANAKGETVDVGALLASGPVIVTFYRGGWCPFCNLELKAYQDVLLRIKAAGATLVAISPEKPDESLSTAEKNALTFEVLSDVGQKVGRAFGLVYEFTDEVKSVYNAFGLDIPARNGAPDEWALPVSATYVIGRDGVIVYANLDTDYRDRADPEEVLKALTPQTVAA